MKNLEKYIPSAIEEMKKVSKNGKISKVYNGYLSSFGVSIIQSGLLSTLASFEAETKESQGGDKRNISNAVLNILKQINNDNSNQTSLISYVMTSEKPRELIKNQIIDITTSLKLAIRTFELIEEKDNKKEG